MIRLTVAVSLRLAFGMKPREVAAVVDLRPNPHRLAAVVVVLHGTKEAAEDEDQRPDAAAAEMRCLERAVCGG